MTAFELGILDGIQDVMGSSFGDWFFPAVTHLGDSGMIWIVLTLILIAVPRTRQVGYVAAASLILQAVICNLILKPAVARTRPCDLVPGIRLLIARPSDYSFPSGHSSAGFAVASALLFCRSKFGVPVLILAAIIAFSRLYLYVHFPSDVLTGALLGIISAFAAWSCKNVTSRKKNEP